MFKEIGKYIMGDIIRNVLNPLQSCGQCLLRIEGTPYKRLQNSQSYLLYPSGNFILPSPEFLLCPRLSEFPVSR